MGRGRRFSFFSVRSKLLGIFLITISIVFILILVLFPRVFREVMIDRAQDDLYSTKQIIEETLAETDFQTNTYLRDRLDAVARAKEIEIWICKEATKDYSGKNIVPVIRVGSPTNVNDLTLSAQSLALIESIRSGQASDDIYYENLFPEFFADDTITMAYATKYVEVRRITVQNIPFDATSTETAVVLINIGLANISSYVNMISTIVIVAFALISIIAAALIYLLSRSITQPVAEMREIANLIAQGDFSRRVEIKSRDEIAELSKAFNTMATELAEVDSSRTAFIANVSHDFRSPLTSIHGFVQAMMDGVIPADQYDKYLKIVFDETNRLSKLTNDLLLLTKIESSQDELNRTRFDINELIRTQSLGFLQRVEEKHLQMKFLFLQEHLFVNADADQIERVIHNLIDNAIKFTRDGDTITAETSIVNHKAYIAIVDTGVGIDEEEARHIFDRFHKSDKSRGLNKTGMGLGLAIVKQIIVSHGETIEVKSSEGRGSRFEFTLPLAPKE